jgi:hypothetical protein
MTTQVYAIKALKIRLPDEEWWEGAGQNNELHPHIVSPLYVSRASGKSGIMHWDNGSMQAECHCPVVSNIPKHEPPMPLEMLQELKNRGQVSLHGCGIHGCWDAGEITRWANHEFVILTLIEAEGTTVLHEDGWRSAGARISAVISPMLEEQLVHEDVTYIRVQEYLEGSPDTDSYKSQWYRLYIDPTARDRERTNEREEFLSSFLGVPIIGAQEAFDQLARTKEAWDAE